MKTVASRNIHLNAGKVVGDHLTAFWQSLGVEMHFSTEKTLYVTGIPHPFCNGVLRTVMPSTIATRRVEETIQKFKSRNLPFHWIVSQESRPKYLDQILEDKGLMPTKKLVGMDKFLIGGENYQTRKCNEIQLFQVDHPKKMKEWAEVFAVVSHLPPKVAYSYSQLLLRSRLQPLCHYVIYLKGKAIGVASFSICKPVARIYHLSIKENDQTFDITSQILESFAARAWRAQCTNIITCIPESISEVFEKQHFERMCELVVYA